MENASRTLWGTFEEDENDTSLLNINFEPIIELAMQHIPETSTAVKSEPLTLPKENFVTYTIRLHQHARQLQSIADNVMFEGARLEQLPVPPLPDPPEEISEHCVRVPLNYIDKEYCEFSLGEGPYTLPLTRESHQKALKHCVAISLAHIGVHKCTRSAINTLTDVLDHYMHTMTQLLRTVVDQEAGGLSTGFPDAIQKVFAEIGVTNLHEFYQNRVVKYSKKMRRECEGLTEKCKALVMPDLTPQLKLEDVPELHFPAALSEVFTPSLEPGFQMLHSLEQEELQGLELLDSVGHDDIKMEIGDVSVQESSPASPRNKKKRKI